MITEIRDWKEAGLSRYDLIMSRMTQSELVTLLHILERAVLTNNKAEEFLEGLKKAIDKALPKN